MDHRHSPFSNFSPGAPPITGRLQLELESVGLFSFECSLPSPTPLFLAGENHDDTFVPSTVSYFSEVDLVYSTVTTSKSFLMPGSNSLTSIQWRAYNCRWGGSANPNKESTRHGGLPIKKIFLKDNYVGFQLNEITPGIQPNRDVETVDARGHLP